MFVKDKGKEELKLEHKKKRLDGWQEKSLHGQYPSRTNRNGVAC